MVTATVEDLPSKVVSVTPAISALTNATVDWSAKEGTIVGDWEGKRRTTALIIAVIPPQDMEPACTPPPTWSTLLWNVTLVEGTAMPVRVGMPAPMGTTADLMTLTIIYEGPGMEEAELVDMEERVDMVNLFPLLVPPGL
mmetsp:Transcript_18645/g.24055  ORF Transcript_18645/g.24055 Transcript_18645/m.24055 type:complete len:140 (+) Transcript_18645:173-592(+)